MDPTATDGNLTLHRLERPPDTPLLLVAGPHRPAIEVARRLAHQWCPTTAAYDVAEFTPTAARWSVEDISAVVACTTRMPVGERGVAIVHRGDDLSGPASDRLLLATERPAAPWTVLLLATDPEALTATLRGRVGHVVAAPADPAEMLGVLGGRHGELAGLLAADPYLAEALLSSPEAAPQVVEVLTTPLAGGIPTTRAVAATDALDGAVGALARSKAAHPVLRRRLAVALLDRWELGVRSLLSPAPQHPAPELAALQRQIVASRRLLWLNGDVLTALAAALAAAPEAGSAGTDSGGVAADLGLPPEDVEPW